MNAPLPVREKPRPVRGFSFLDAARRTPRANWLLGITGGLLYVVVILALRWQEPHTDEITHYSQIWLFAQGDWRLLPELTTIPGYHLLVAAILKLSGAVSLQGARLASAAFGLCAAAGFHALRARLWPGTQTLTTAQFLVLPILVPLFFLAYTDVLALALLLWATWASVNGRHWLAALLLAGLVLVRQHLVVWSGLLALFALQPTDLRHALRDWRQHLPVLAPYLLPVVGFVAFWLGNGSISLSTSQAGLHPDLSLHGGNLLFALALVGAVLPLHVLRALARALRHRLAIPLALLPAVALVFWIGFRADNPYNGVLPDFYLHNRLVLWLVADPWLRALAALLAGAASVTLATTALRPAHGRWLLAVGALFLAASWLIEFRYAMVPLVLWLALREPATRRVEVATLAGWFVLSCWFMRGMLAQQLFL